MSTPHDTGRNELSANGQLSLPTMVEALVRQLRTIILAGEIKPGGRLIEERLTERFGVSRPPLREALRILQRDGLVQSLPRRGFIVVPITARDVREIYSMRMALERLAVELGVPVADPARLQPLHVAVERMRAAALTADRDEMVAANSAFHAALVALSDHSRLTRTYESLLMQMRLCMAFNLELRRQMQGDPAESVRRHEALLTLIEAGDQHAVVHELAHHGDRSFLDHLDDLVGGDG
jgi:DNA-binding GntR family transcriptional regulator